MEQGYLPVELPDDRTTVIRPRHQPGLPDEKRAVWEALERPIEAPPLREWVRPGMKICILFTDITRATPNHRLIPWLLEYLSFVPPENVTLLNQTGTHRPNTRAELERMLTPEVVAQYRVRQPRVRERSRSWCIWGTCPTAPLCGSIGTPWRRTCGS
jgi:nickel-dependent lactate racemase